MFHDIFNNLHAVGVICRAYLPEALLCAFSICLIVHLLLLGKKMVDALHSTTKESGNIVPRYAHGKGQEIKS